MEIHFTMAGADAEHFTLTAADARRVAWRIASARYQSPADVISAALDALDALEAAERRLIAK